MNPKHKAIAEKWARQLEHFVEKHQNDCLTFEDAKKFFQSAIQEAVEPVEMENEELKMIRATHPWHGCLTGDCPHDNANQCLESIKAYVCELEHQNQDRDSGTASADAGSLQQLCSAEYAVEWNGGEGWKRLAQKKPTEQEARIYARWVLNGEHQEYRIIEITEKILPNTAR